jgi:hypothetical protein
MNGQIVILASRCANLKRFAMQSLQARSERDSEIKQSEAWSRGALYMPLLTLLRTAGTHRTNHADTRFPAHHRFWQGQVGIRVRVFLVPSQRQAQ